MNNKKSATDVIDLCASFNKAVFARPAFARAFDQTITAEEAQADQEGRDKLVAVLEKRRDAVLKKSEEDKNKIYPEDTDIEEFANELIEFHEDNIFSIFTDPEYLKAQFELIEIFATVAQRAEPDVFKLYDAMPNALRDDDTIATLEHYGCKNMAQLAKNAI